jgi:hypothetical protein
MSKWHLERALYQLAKGSRLAEEYAQDPEAVLARYDLDPDEIAIIQECDAVEMYRRGVHPNLIRNFSATVDVDYVARYRDAGLAP